MEQALNNYLQLTLQQGFFLPLLLSFFAGVITSIGPCNVSLIPVLLAYIGGQRDESRFKGLTISMVFTIGTALTFAIMGLCISILGGVFGQYKTFLMILVGMVCIIVGLRLLKVVKLELPIIGLSNIKAKKAKNFFDVLILGMAMGIVGSQCATPFLVVILSLVFATGKLIFGTCLLFVYGLGRGTILIAAGTFTGLITKLEFISKRANYLEYLAGLFVTGLGLYYFWIA